MWQTIKINQCSRQVLLNLIFLVIVVVGCNNDDPPQQGEDIVLTDVLVPLEVGNIWSGTYTRFDSTGIDSTTHILTYEIVGDTAIGRYRWFVEELRLDDTLPARNLYKNLPTGLFRLETEIFSVDSALMSFKYPVKRNDRYERFDRGIVVVPSTDTAIVVPRGTYSCIHYRTTLSQYVNDSGVVIGGGLLNEYVSPGIGYIKWEQFIVDNNDSTTLVGKFELDSIVLVTKIPSVGLPTGP